MDKTRRAVVSGSRLFNPLFGLPRNGENITRSLGTCPSGSPPSHATINRRTKEDPRFSTASRLNSFHRFAPQKAAFAHSPLRRPRALARSLPALDKGNSALGPLSIDGLG